MVGKVEAGSRDHSAQKVGCEEEYRAQRQEVKAGAMRGFCATVVTAKLKRIKLIRRKLRKVKTSPNFSVRQEYKIIWLLSFILQTGKLQESYLTFCHYNEK